MKPQEPLKMGGISHKWDENGSEKKLTEDERRLLRREIKKNPVGFYNYFVNEILDLKGWYDIAEEIKCKSKVRIVYENGKYINSIRHFRLKWLFNPHYILGS